ncbi:uncharacterized protein JCM10292_000219 [Rhodotorula paludigena]|uniref:uncharacterized protein n=1 Tax=Rhodotorula paludigena TaxID=86838 RepID=UPI00317CF54C
MASAAASSDVHAVNTEPSLGTEQGVVLKRCKARLLSLANFSTWDFSGVVLRETAGMTSPGWRELSALPYRNVTKSGDSLHWSMTPCAVVGFSERVESSHLITDASGCGKADIDLLIACKVVPDFARHELPSNCILLSHSIKGAIERREAHLVPQHDALDARLAAEAAYQQLRISKEFGDHPPPVKKARLSPIGYGVVRTERDIEAHNAAARALLPPLIFPASTNLLIYSAKDRADQSPPAPPAVVADSEIKTLLRYWFLTDETPLEDISNLLVRTLEQIDPSSPYAKYAQPGGIRSLGDVASFPFPSVPTSALISCGKRPPAGVVSHDSSLLPILAEQGPVPTPAAKVQSWLNDP